MIAPERMQNTPNILYEQQEVLQDSVTRGVEFALQTMDARYGPDQSVADWLPFHNKNHPADVMRRSQLIMETIQAVTGSELVDEHDAELVPLLAAGHDTVQKYDLVPATFDGRDILKRVRHTGENEKETTGELVGYMQQENANSTVGEIYTNRDMEVVDEAFDATVPGWDPEVGTVVQPNKEHNKNVIADVIALADLGSAGIDGAEAAVKDSDLLFLEENVDVTAMLDAGEELDGNTKEWLKQRIVKSTESQKGFIEGRKQMLDKDLEHFPSDVAASLKEKVFNKFDDALAAVDDELARRRAATADEVIFSIASWLPEKIAA